MCADGFFPVSLIESPDGNFYGTAVGGGVGMNAQGTVFKMTPSGQVSVIYSFAEEPRWISALRLGSQRSGRGHRRVSLRGCDFQRAAWPGHGFQTEQERHDRRPA